MTTIDVTAEAVAWDLETLLPEPGEAGVHALLARADELVTELVGAREQIASFDAGALAEFLTRLVDLNDAIGRAGNYAGLQFSTDTTDPAQMPSAIKAPESRAQRSASSA